MELCCFSIVCLLQKRIAGPSFSGFAGDWSTTGRRIVTISQVECRGVVVSRGKAALDLNAQLKAETLRAATFLMCFSVTKPGNTNK